MKAQRPRTAFTLIEVMIVVTIMAILSALIITEFRPAVEDAKNSALLVDLNKMRTLIELYKMDHLTVPPDGTNTLAQLVSPTNVQGQIGGAGPDFPYGPYITGSIPANPFTTSRKITFYTGAGTPAASGASDAGWIYNSTTGGIWCDDPQHVTD